MLLKFFSLNRITKVPGTIVTLLAVLGLEPAFGADHLAPLETNSSNHLTLCGIQTIPMTIRKSGTQASPRIVTICNSGFRIRSRTSPAITILASHITLQGGTYSSDNSPAIVVSGSNVTISNVVVRDSKHGIHISGNGLSNISILDSEIFDNQLVGIILNEYRPWHYYKGLKIQRNNVYQNGNHGIRLWFDDKTRRSSGVSDVVISHNEVHDNFADGIVVVQHSVDYDAPDPIMFDVSIENNIVRRNAGGIALRGVGSSSNDYGRSFIRDNICSENRSVTGGINIFWSSYLDILRNDCSDNNSDTIDGNGILVDHGNRKIRIENNRTANNSGNADHLNSGVGIMVLDSSEIYVTNNVVDGNKIGVYFGGQAGAQDVVVSQNQITNSRRVGLFVHEAAPTGGFDFSNNTIRGQSEPFEIKNAKALLRNSSNTVSRQ